MKIYTKTGDRGKTSLIGGKRVSKHHIRIEAYGTIDELIAYISLIRDQAISDEIKETLLEILDRLMTCASVLATDNEGASAKLPEILTADIEFLEREIDRYESELVPLQSFIIPGGHPVSSYCHIARTVCRRAERIIIRLSEELFVPEAVIKYINRLSDYLFVLSRKILKDFNIEEIPWQPRL